MADLSPPPADAFPREPASIQCVIDAAARYRLPANVLLALASNEHGKNGQVVRNKASPTADLGHFQINTATHRRELAPLGIHMEDVLWRGCFNAMVAAYLLHKRLAEPSTADYWTRVANYHSRTPSWNALYQKRLKVHATAWAAWLSEHYAVSVAYR